MARKLVKPVQLVQPRAVPAPIVVVVALVASLLVAVAAPAQAAAHNRVRPAVVGKVVVGKTVSCAPGRWSRPVRSPRWSWHRDGRVIAGATARTYRVRGADARHRLSCGVQPAGARRAVSRAVEVTSAPTLQSGPTVTLTGSTLSCDRGSWSDSPTSYSFSWTRNGSPVGGGDPTLGVDLAGDAGATYVCLVRATNDAGSSGFLQSAGLTIGGGSTTSAPVPSAGPSLTVFDAVVTCDPGTWPDGTRLAFSWTRDGSPYAGTSPTISIGRDDIGHQVVCLVSGSNAGGGSGYVASPELRPTLEDAAPRPRNLTLPVASQAVQTLSCTTGTWRWDPTGYAYSWTRDGVVVDGATAASYAVTPADWGHLLACRVTATNATGPTTATSADLTAMAPPQRTGAAPSISQTGTTLTCVSGGWDGTEAAFTYAWTRDGAPVAAPDPTLNTLPITGPSASYACVQTAANAYGSTDATSSPLASVGLPTQLTPPAVGQSGQTLSCDPGTWSEGPTFTYAWLRDGSAMGGASGATFGLADTDHGHAFVCRVTAGNLAGSETADAAAVTAMAPPRLVGARPTVSQSGTTLTCTTGAWDGTQATFSYSWLKNGTAIPGGATFSNTLAISGAPADYACRQRARNAYGSDVAQSDPLTSVLVPSATTAPSVTQTLQNLHCDPGVWTYGPTLAYAWTVGGVTLPGADGPILVIPDSAIGQTATCTVTATNVAGAATETSAPVVALPPLPANTAAPTLTQLGLSMTCVRGTWTYDPGYLYTFTVGGAVVQQGPASLYRLTIADYGQTVACSVAATNARGTVSAAATTTRPATGSTAVVPGSRSTVSQSGTTLTCESATWDRPDYSYTYSWTRNGTGLGGASPSNQLTGATSGAVYTCSQRARLGAPYGNTNSTSAGYTAT